jgi:hypothetical protein
MKKIVAIVIAASLLMAMVPSFATAAPEGIPDDADRIFKFNIIGVKHAKDAEMDGDNGKRIFVNLDKPSAIWLKEGETFDILDANGTDKDGATFQMPKPGLDPYNLSDPGDADVWSDYSIYIRSLGKPGGWATITTCADLLDSNFAGLLSGKFVSVLNREGIFGGYASVEQVGKEITERPKGKSIFTNVTAELTTIVFKVEVEVQADEDVNGDGVIDELDTEIIIEYVRVPIFDDILENEYWEYDNHGLKLLQVWIYDNSTDVSEGDAAILE